MTDCTTNPIEFSRLKGRKIQADFNGGKPTSDGQAVPLREIERHLGRIDAINPRIPAPRNQDPIVPQQKTLPAQRIFEIAPGDPFQDLFHQIVVRIRQWRTPSVVCR